MKSLATLFLTLLMALPSLAATTFPASTNANQTFFGQNTFLQPIIGLTTSNVPSAGGTVTGALLSTSPTTNSPAQDEMATAGWVRNLFENLGSPYYNTTNLAAFGTNVGSGQPLYTFAVDVIPAPANRTYTTADFLTNNGYVGSVVTTNTFLQIGGPVEVHAYLGFTGGVGGPTLTLHPEIYYSYDRTNWQGDFSSANQNIVNGTTNVYQFVVSVPTINSTNSTGFYLQRRFKVGTVAGTGVRTLTVLVGTNLVSGPNIAGHIDLPSPQASAGNAFLQANQTFTGQNTFSQEIIGTVGLTNILNRTNSQTQTIDFQNKAYSEGDFATNATFAWLGFTGLVLTQYQSATIWLTNSSGSLISFTAPANCHTTGTLNCTNVTECVFKHNAGRWTNMLALPLW